MSLERSDGSIHWPASVAERWYGNAVAERLAVTTNTSCFAGVLAAVGKLSTRSNGVAAALRRV